MAYEVQNFEDGEKLTAEQLNHMEAGIYANSANMAYEKQNFVNGQKLTAEQLNHMEAGIYANSVSSGSSGDAAVVEQATPTISVSTSGLITATATQEAGLVAAGTKSSTKQLTTQPAQTITPGTSNKTIASGRYLTGTQTIKGDSNLKAENIKSGVSIFGVAGSLTVSSGGNTIVSDICELHPVTISKEKTNTTVPILTGSSFLAEHRADEGLYVILISLDNIANTYDRISCISQGNRCVMSLGTSGYYGDCQFLVAATTYTSAMASSAVIKAPINSDESLTTAKLNVNSVGDLNCVLPSGKYLAAGSYLAVLILASA